MPPNAATRRGPKRSCRNPATTNQEPTDRMAMVKTTDTSVRVQPKRSSNGATKTLQA